MSKLSIFTDGGSRGNPGPAASGVVVKDGEEIVFETSRYLGITTNNDAEYTAVEMAMEWLKDCPLPSLIESVQFFADSQLMVEQLNGHYKVRNENLMQKKAKIERIKRSLKYPISFYYIPRGKNFRADQLVNVCLDSQK
ncbi:MAG TPA: ribonuclease HI family protein [Patescibacteria group bacterium]|nr:ribonuclease HI family protein [Patescibacteria group bacterium]